MLSSIAMSDVNTLLLNFIISLLMLNHSYKVIDSRIGSSILKS